jgi:hypothetical protein
MLGMVVILWCVKIENDAKRIDTWGLFGSVKENAG